ncbi:tetraacyldisaccharide 4'-kinase [Candidatus Pelagibacter sp.]|jgi:tetraacyldisaccharide 4'-kinase|nr:tetraacyldisaccharide 4'-kinase [Candidatus Pelagibacter sp.]
MKLTKPKFWLYKSFFAYFFFPLTLVTYIINLFKKLSFKKKISIKTICVGNLYIGGTGKTSSVIEIHKILKKKIKTVLIKKKYQNQQDEIDLLKKEGKVISTDNRLNSLLYAQKKKFELALLDDGLQQKNIAYDLKIVCFNSEEGFGNSFLLPAGPLRESPNELKKYSIAFINGEKKNKKLYKQIKSINKDIKIFEGKYKIKNLKNFNRNKEYLIFSGIGNPQEFENTLIKYKFKIRHKIIYPDHYKISKYEIKNIKKIAKKLKLNIITTEKDYLRLRKTEINNIQFLKVNLNISKINELKKILFSYT